MLKDWIDTSDALTEDQEAYLGVLDGMIAEGILDESFYVEEGVTDSELTTLIDAKLSAAARKKLKSGSFCGPGRSFPANDCPHVRAGFRLLNRAKVSSATKARIRGCLSRKNKSMSCGVGASDSSEFKISKRDSMWCVIDSTEKVVYRDASYLKARSMQLNLCDQGYYEEEEESVTIEIKAQLGPVNGHSHDVILDDNQSGTSMLAGSGNGHVHSVVRGVVQRTEGHTHPLLVMQPNGYAEDPESDDD